MHLLFILLGVYLAIGIMTFAISVGVDSVKIGYKISFEDSEFRENAPNCAILAVAWPIIVVLGVLWCIFLGPATLVQKAVMKYHRYKAKRLEKKNKNQDRQDFPELIPAEQIDEFQTGWQ